MDSGNIDIQQVVGFINWDKLPYALLLIAVAFVVLRDLSTRRLSRAVPSVSVALITAVAITSFGAFGSAIEGW